MCLIHLFWMAIDRGSVDCCFVVVCAEVLFVLLFFRTICSSQFDLRFLSTIGWVVIASNWEYCENNAEDVMVLVIVWFKSSDLTENGSSMYSFILLEAADIRPSNDLTIKDELEILLFEEQKECDGGCGGLGWKCNSSSRTIGKRKIITMTFSLNGEGAKQPEG